MKELPNNWTRSGFDHKVIARRGMVALVQRQHASAAFPHWEVAVIRIHPERLLHGRRIQAGEAYPSSEEWGLRGWTYSTLEAARAKFESL